MEVFSVLEAVFEILFEIVFETIVEFAEKKKGLGLVSVCTYNAWKKVIQHMKKHYFIR